MNESTGAFATELQVRLAEARAQLAAAEALDDPLAAQLAEADVRELEALAGRNDVPVAEVHPS